MSHAALTAKYRPQTFAQVAGQDTVKAILSRASLESRVAPAYLFSGTRGVGKTTLARIFAKALNCRSGPAAEPCNACDQCRAITAGSAVDVVEIDGASNRGIDDVRRLKEVVGYAPMEGGYRIFIIDEAHMLSREAFNALLKTLEEPPARVTFIMATTEPHKFPATIISRCQHFVFKPLSESGLLSHLSQVLANEGVSFEESALRLIARRGAGSVRDSMSLLGQVLALGEGTLTEDSARAVLGLAGQEAFIRLLEAVKGGDSVTLSALLRDMLDNGLDMGFFLRELASLWRNMFMLRQSGERALSVVELPENEARRYLEISNGFSLAHIHACWQMTLEGQRRVLTSLEPALALELLLLNVGMLPQLLSLENLSAIGRKNPPPGSGAPGMGGQGSTGQTGSSVPTTPSGRSAAPDMTSPSATVAADPSSPESAAVSSSPTKNAERENASPRSESFLREASSEFENDSEAEPDFAVSDDLPPPPIQDDYDEAAIQSALREQELQPDPVVSGDTVLLASFAESGVAAAKSNDMEEPDWDSIFAVCEVVDAPPWFSSLLRRVNAGWQNGELHLEAHDGFTLDRLEDAQVRARLEDTLRQWCGSLPPLKFSASQVVRKTREDLKAEVLQHPLVKEVQEHFGGYVIDYGQLR